MQLAIVLGLVYLIVMPIIFRLIAFAQKKLLIDRRAAKAKGNKNAVKNLPKPVWPKWRERIAFTMKDKRDVVLKKPKKGEEPKSSNIQNRKMFFGLWIAGLLVTALGSFIGMWQIILTGYAIFFITMIFGIKSADAVIVTRQNVYNRMFSIARLKLGQSAEYSESPQAVITVLEWNDYVKPQKVEFLVPDSFGAAGEEGFLQQYNQIFGTETTWVPSNDPDPKDENRILPGWNYEEGKVTIYAVPPLPGRADWDEHYVLQDGVAWSFFPIGLGVENGIELPNPKTGSTENVLGFDLSGEQAKVGSKHGVKVSGTISTSPMVFIGGGTGGGKSLSIDTLVEVIRHENVEY